MGTSLVGKILYVHASSQEAWLPWEFLSGAPFSMKLLVTGSESSHHCVEASTSWTVILRPAVPKDWSCLATLVRGAGSGSVLLTFDVGCPPVPDSFATFLDAVIAEGRVSLTQVWIGIGVRIPGIPDAVLFPPLTDREGRTAAHALISRLPGRYGHGAAPTVPVEDWNTLVMATTASRMGICVTDVGESGWTLFWHKPADSLSESRDALVRRGLAWIRTGTQLLESMTPS